MEPIHPIQADRARLFRVLHQPDKPLLLLPCAWDIPSALLLQHAGAAAIATSSAALAWAHGCADGEQLPRQLLLDSVGRMAAVLNVPMSVDIETGYSHDPAEVAELAVAVVDAGAVGINIEDGAAKSELLADKIRAIRQRVPADRLFINARTDVYLRGLAEGDAAVAMCIKRIRQYGAAGADGAFVPGLSSPDLCRRIAATTDLPLGVMSLPGLPSLDMLQLAGVRRISAGPMLFVASFGALLDSAGPFLQQGRCEGSATLDFRRMEQVVTAPG